MAAAALPQAATIERALEGIGNHVYFAGDVVVRLGTGSDAAMFPRSVAMMRAAKPTVRVPEVLFADCSRARFEVPVMVLERMPGTTLKRLWPTLSAGERLDLIADVASQLGRLHAIDPTDVLGAGFTTPWWRERVSRIERLLAELRPHPEFPDAWFDTIARYVDEHRDALTSSPAAAPLHNDVNFGNVLVADGQVTALLDFDDALCGPPEEDWWQLVARCDEAVPPLPLELLPQIPEFDLSADGVLERFQIGEIQNTLDLLSGELSWVEPATAVLEARETYEATFESSEHERLLARLAQPK